VLLLSAFYANVQAQHPSTYGEVKGRTNIAMFSFPKLEREVLHSVQASFYAPKPVSMRFRVLIRPDGSVKYVKPILDPAVSADFRLGGAHALYKYEFAAIAEEEGDQWTETVMQVGGEGEE
jgi:hypothetical protein